MIDIAHLRGLLKAEETDNATEGQSAIRKTIVAARNALPELLDEIEALRKEVKSARCIAELAKEERNHIGVEIRSEMRSEAIMGECLLRDQIKNLEADNAENKRKGEQLCCALGSRMIRDADTLKVATAIRTVMHEWGTMDWWDKHEAGNLLSKWSLDEIQLHEATNELKKEIGK
jgi:seryl-tRNA synthetase